MLRPYSVPTVTGGVFMTQTSSVIIAVIELCCTMNITLAPPPQAHLVCFSHVPLLTRLQE